MDHSLCGYLNRCTDEELAGILQYFLRDENIKAYYYVIPEIIDTGTEGERKIFLR